MKKQLIISLLAFQFLCIGAIAQDKKIVVLGSSTAKGFGASTYPYNGDWNFNDSCWVKRLQTDFRKNTTDGIDTIITNLAVGGKNTYHAMPTNFVPPPGRPLSDPTMNITLALSYNPDAIIINFPSNDIAVGHTKLEIMDNFRLMFSLANSNGVKCFIATTQPRSDFYPNLTMMQYQRDLVDSIQNNFGMYSIDFWTDLVGTTPAYSIRPEVAYTNDGIHVNDYGHRLLFLKAVQKPYFTVNAPLPLKLIDFNAQLQSNTVLLKWKTTDEDPNSFFEIERSNDGRQFNNLHRLNANGLMNVNDYAFTDPQPLEGKIYYRLKIIEPSKTSYSKVISITNKGRQLSISSIYVDGSNLNIKISSKKNESIDVNIINLSGMLVKKWKQQINTTSAVFSIPVSNLTAGEYILRIINADGNSDTERFIKLK